MKQLTLDQVKEKLPVGVKLLVNRHRKTYILLWFDLETELPRSKAFSNQINRQSIIDYAETLKPWDLNKPCLQIGDIIEIEYEQKRWIAKVIEYMKPFYLLEIDGFGHRKHYSFNQFSLFVHHKISMPLSKS
jgi:SAM-dependent MidA family methyltransferase